MGESIITWNVPNVVTVWLIVILGVFLFSFIGKALKTSKKGA